MYIISKTIKEKEYIYSNKCSILCSSKKQAEKLAEHLNNHNEDTNGDFKLKNDEYYKVYEIDNYDPIPRYKLKSTKNKITLVENY